MIKLIRHLKDLLWKKFCCLNISFANVRESPGFSTLAAMLGISNELQNKNAESHVIAIIQKLDNAVSTKENSPGAI